MGLFFVKLSSSSAIGGLVASCKAVAPERAEPKWCTCRPLPRPILRTQINDLIDRPTWVLRARADMVSCQQLTLVSGLCDVDAFALYLFGEIVQNAISTTGDLTWEAAGDAHLVLLCGPVGESHNEHTCTIRRWT